MIHELKEAEEKLIETIDFNYRVACSNLTHSDRYETSYSTLKWCSDISSTYLRKKSGLNGSKLDMYVESWKYLLTPLEHQQIIDYGRERKVKKKQFLQSLFLFDLRNLLRWLKLFQPVLK